VAPVTGSERGGGGYGRILVALADRLVQISYLNRVCMPDEETSEEEEGEGGGEGEDRLRPTNAYSRRSAVGS